MQINILLKAIIGIFLSIFIVAITYRLGLFFSEYWLLIVLLVWVSIIIKAYLEKKKFKSSNGAEGIVIYIDYYDIFKCLSVALVPFIIVYISASFNQPKSGAVFSALYAIGMTLHICYESAKIHQLKDLPIIFLTKFSLCFVLAFAMLGVLNPSGKTARQREQNRAIATLILMMLAPLIYAFVLDDEEKAFALARAN